MSPFNTCWKCGGCGFHIEQIAAEKWVTVGCTVCKKKEEPMAESKFKVGDHVVDRKGITCTIAQVDAEPRYGFYPKGSPKGEIHWANESELKPYAPSKRERMEEALRKAKVHLFPYQFQYSETSKLINQIDEILAMPEEP